MNSNQFWMVWNPARNQPTHRHASEQSAITEAERLARLNRGEQFYVLEAVALRIADDMTRVDLRRDEIPF